MLPYEIILNYQTLKLILRTIMFILFFLYNSKITNIFISKDKKFSTIQKKDNQTLNKALLL